MHMTEVRAVLLFQKTERLTDTKSAVTAPGEAITDPVLPIKIGTVMHELGDH